MSYTPVADYTDYIAHTYNLHGFQSLEVVEAIKNGETLADAVETTRNDYETVDFWESMGDDDGSYFDVDWNTVNTVAQHKADMLAQIRSLRGVR